MPCLKVEGDEQLTAAINGNVAVVVDFSASWCGPCKTIAPIYEKMSNSDEFAGIAFVKVDFETLKTYGAGITAVPTFQLYLGGKQVGEVRGAKLEELKAN